MFDVAIIGCGPVGAFAANLLGRAGLSVLAVEREIDPFPLPRAVHLDHEMMRLFQSAGVIDRLLPGMRDTEGHLHIGSDRGVIRYMGTVGRPRPYGWSNDYFFYQPELESELRSALTSYPNVEMRLGTEFVNLEQTDGAVRLRFQAHGDASSVEARWVIACDGARSAVRRALGVRLSDLDFEEPWLVVDAEVEGPLRFPPLGGVPADADLQKLSVMMCDPARPATIVPGRGNHRRWEFMLLPGEDDLEMMRPEKVAELVAPWLDGVDHRIIRAATYRFHGLIAERWQVGNVFLAGDAAHQTPPFFGQGMCHGLRDVANLAWKMDMIANDRAPENLLESYQPERDPHVRAVISAAVDAGRYICILDPEAARERDVAMREAARQQVTHATAADLIPPIAEGIIASSPGTKAERFIQPFIEDGAGPRLLDDVAGRGWRLFAATPEMAKTARELVSARMPGIGLSVIDASKLADGGTVLAWLDARAAGAAIIRPDFYVFGLASADAAVLIDDLAAKLGLDRRRGGASGMTLTSDQAASLVTAALDIARGRDLRPLAVMVVDAGGHPVAFRREDGASLFRHDIARAKAVGAVGMGADTREVAARAAGNPAFFTSVVMASGGDLALSPGGVLLRDGAGVILGAIGISGDTGEADEECAIAAMETCGLRQGRRS